MEIFVSFYSQYTWNDNEMYLFKSSMAYALRQYYTDNMGQVVDFRSVLKLNFYVLKV